MSCNLLRYFDVIERNKSEDRNIFRNKIFALNSAKGVVSERIFKNFQKLFSGKDSSREPKTLLQIAEEASTYKMDDEKDWRWNLK